MAKGFLIFERKPNGLEEIADLEGTFDIESGDCVFFDPKKKVYRAIEKEGKKKKCHIALICGTKSSVSIGPGISSYKASGKFYRITPDTEECWR